MKTFCYAAVTIVLAALQVQGELYGGRMGSNGHYDGITIDSRRNRIFAPTQGEPLPPVGSYYVHLNETTQNDKKTFKLCKENTAMEGNAYDLIVDPGNFQELDMGIYKWSYNFTFGTDHAHTPYVLLVDDGSGIYGVSGDFYWINETATTIITVVTVGPETGAATVTFLTTVSEHHPESTTPTTVSTMDVTLSHSPSSPDSTPSTSPTSVVSPSPTTSPTEGSSPSGSSGPSSAAVIGGAVGGALGGVILALVAAMLVILRRRRARKTNKAYPPPDDFHGKPELDNISSPRAELDSPRPPKELDTFYAPTELPSPQPDSDTKAIAGRGKTASPTLDGVAGLGHDHNGTPRPERSSSDEGPYELPGLG